MTEPIIRVEGVSKRYVLSHQSENRPTNFREVIVDAFGSIFRRFRAPGATVGGRTQEEFWALRDVSFDVQPGEVVGFIGRNGAGKSTLLKVLSRITEPTSGRIVLRGRVASLLEVGTGFHPELSGRENIYLNGAILGMSKVEIKRHFDAIVAFAEIERFLDTPVKRYSSGMYVRLAFAVAAHLEPEILIVDEVLAVGDTQFQKKCLGKMEEVRGQGRTVLFVSHNMGMVKRLCNKAVMLQKGVVTKAGNVDDVLAHYLSVGVTYTGAWTRSAPMPDAPGMYFREISIRTMGDEITGHTGTTLPFQLVVRVLVTKRQERSQLAIRFTNQEAIHVFTVCSTDELRTYVPFEEGEHEFRIEVPAEFLMPGVYTLQFVSHAPFVKLYEVVDDELALTVEDTGGHATCCGFTPAGLVTPIFPWKHSKADRGSSMASVRS